MLSPSFQVGHAVIFCLDLEIHEPILTFITLCIRVNGWGGMRTVKSLPIFCLLFGYFHIGDQQQKLMGANIYLVYAGNKCFLDHLRRLAKIIGCKYAMKGPGDLFRVSDMILILKQNNRL